MALAAATIWEVRSAAGNDTNGGAFVEGATGTDYSQQNSKNTVGTDISTTDAVAAGTTTITSATANFGASIVGNVVYFSGGAGSITGQWRQVTARASATSITIDASIAASVGMTMNIGGALATTQAVLGGGQLVSGMAIYATGGESRAAILTAITLNIRVSGYSTVRGDGGKYVYTATAGMASLFASSGTTLVENLKVDGAANTFSAAAFVCSSGTSVCRNIEITGVSGSATMVQISGPSRQIWIHDNAGTGAVIATAFACQEFEVNGNANTASVISLPNAMLVLEDFSIYNNGGDGIKITGGGAQISNGAIYSQAGAGIDNTVAAAGLPGIEAERVIITGCVGAAIAMTNAATNKGKIRLKNCYEFNNGASSAGKFEGTLTTLSGDPFTSASTGNFALSSTGANYSSLNAVGFTYPRGTTVDFGAAGAAQPPPSSGSGGQKCYAY